MAEQEKPGLLARKDWRVLVIAVVLGVLAVVLMNSYVRSRKKADEKRVAVAIATQDIPAATEVERGMIGEGRFPASAVPGNVVPGNNMSSVVGRALSVKVGKGQPIYWDFVTVSLDSGVGQYLDYEHRERAFAMVFGNPLTDAVNPGDIIDIYGTIAHGGTVKGMQLLPGVVVIDRVGRHLVLAVTREEALYLTVAGTMCTPTFTVRSPDETGRDTTLTPVTSDEIFGESEKRVRERIERGPIIVKR